jgi:Response regulator containing CheY-like receiver domain and AraC-type DNA-binding domain
MLIDDQEVIRKEIKRLPVWGEKTGFMIAAEAKDGDEALIKLSAMHIDLVITDIRMPKIDGLELLQRINERKLCPCVVLLSDYTEFAYARQSLIYGAFDYLGKPVYEGLLLDLLARVEHFLAEKALAEERIKKLEAVVETRAGLFFPDSEVTQIIIHILNSGTEIALLVSNMAATTEAAFDGDIVRTALVLKNAMAEISKAVFQTCAWLNQFMEIGNDDHPDFLQPPNLEALKQVLVAEIEKIVTLLRKIHYYNDNQIVKRVCHYVLQNNNRDLSIHGIAEALFLNRSYISETFRQKTGMTVIEFITLIKIEQAKKLIRENKLRNYEIADKLGFKDVEYFSRLFKKYTGSSPTEFRQ